MAEHDFACSREVDEILSSDLPALDKVAQAFGCITAFIIHHAGAEIELALALGDREELVKSQIKRETIRHARSIFESCYLRVAGRRPWDDTDRSHA